jgi:predicted Rossmann fold flavoprotein
MSRKKLVVIGGGAAGFFCAVNAARLKPELDVILVEKSNKLLSKVKISGGGRCNVTHACFDITEMSKRYPRGQHFARKAFHRFFTTDTINWFEERGVKLKTEEDGRMFPVSDSSQTIIDCLMKEADRYGVKIMMNKEVKKINIPAVAKGLPQAQQHSTFNIQFSSGEDLLADYVCVACGGYPKSSMFEWLKELGHTIEEPVPSLFTFNMPGHPITKLMGVSVENARVKITGTKLEQTGPLLITHWGLSGPAILRLSAWGARELAICNWQFAIFVNWLPQFTEQQLADEFRSLRQDRASQKTGTKNPFGLPQRLWSFLLEHSGIREELRWADLPAKDQNRLIRNLCNCEFSIKGKTTFKEEFVTAGGIKLNEVDSNTMMSKKIPHLYFAGEILDVDGITGGFNFQHAWTSGFVAACSIGEE